MAFYKKNWAVTRLKKYFDHRGFLLRFGLSAVLLLFGFVASAHQSNFVKTSDLTVEGEKTVKFALDWLFTGPMRLLLWQLTAATLKKSD